MDQEKMNEFKQREIEIENSGDVADRYYEYKSLSDEIHEEGDSDWAIKLYIKALEYVGYTGEWWDDFNEIVAEGKLDKEKLRELFEKWEINVRENRGWTWGGDCYDELLYQLEKHIGDEEWIDKIKTEQDNSYTINDVKGPFGTSREGDGRVVYLFTKELDLTAIKLVVSTFYHTFVKDEDGDIVRNWAEYDPSHLDTEIIGTVEDEVTFLEIVNKISGDNSDLEKFELFLRKEILEKNIPLIFIDSEDKSIDQVNDKSINAVLKKYKDELSIFIREYDQAGDY